MTTTDLRGIGDFRHALCALLGRVLPEFGNACGFHTFGRSTPIAWRFAFVWQHVSSDDDIGVHVLCRTNPSTRRIESTEPAAPKSP